MIRVYAVCERSAARLPRPLEAVEVGGLLAVIGRDADVPATPTPEDLWDHERVVEQLMDDRAVLPMRFGTSAPGVDELRAAIAARRDEFTAALDRVRGRVELGVRAVTSAGGDSEPPPESGRAYLDRRLAADVRARGVHESLAALATASRRRPARADGELLCAAYLVDADGVERFRAAVRRLEARDPGVALLCTGPWPPYSFVGGRA